MLDFDGSFVNVSVRAVVSAVAFLATFRIACRLVSLIPEML